MTGAKVLFYFITSPWQCFSTCMSPPGALLDLRTESQLSLQFKGLPGPRTLQVVVSSYADLKDFGVYRNMGGGGESTFLIEKKGIRQTTARLGKQRCDRLWDGEEKKQTQSGTSSTHVHRYLDYSWTVSGLIIASGQEFSTSVKKGYFYKTTLSRG